MPNEVRMGVIGVGGMGGFHAEYLLENKVKRAKLTALCDVRPEALSGFNGVKTFSDSGEMIRSGLVDAVLIATPHYFHTTIGIDAIENGLHVLTEKPIAVHKKDCQRMIDAHKDKKLKFGVMFNTRTEPLWIKVKELVKSGALGEMRRVNWILTDWFRTEAYYASGTWRATWAGEGGGILVNQCPHNFDLLQWIVGMPVRIRGTCFLGKYHDIEVEDDFTAYFEYANCASGVMVATTGEAPGANRLQIDGDMGRLVVEKGKITFHRNEVSMDRFRKECPENFASPDTWEINVPWRGHGGHRVVTQSFVDAILDNTPLVAEMEEGINGVEFANSILYSSLTGKDVDLPLDADAYEGMLKKLIADSKFEKKTAKSAAKKDITSSFK